MSKNGKNKIIVYLKRYYFIFPIILFIVLTATLFLINNFTKTTKIFRDEFYYIELAKSIFYGNGIAINQVSFSFQKILYPAVISPCFAINDPITRLKIITLINSLLLSSSVFPIYLIGKRIKLSTPALTALLLFSVVSPILMFAVSFMSENLYYPLILWVVYLWLYNQEKKSPVFACLGGFLCYALFLCKEIALILLAILIVLEFIWPLFNRLYNKESYRSGLDYKRLINAGAYLVSFFSLFLIFKLTLFKNLGPSYNQTDPSAINSAEKFFYVIFAAFYYIAGVGLIVLFIPVMYPFFCYKKINQSTQRLFLLAFTFLFAVAFATAYSVTVREDYFSQKFDPRLITRYVAPCIICFVAIMLHILDNRQTFILSLTVKQKRGVWITLLSFLTLFLFIFRAGPIVNLAGSIIPLPYYAFRDWFLSITHQEINTTYCLLYGVVNLFVIAFVLLINYFLINKSHPLYHRLATGIVLTTFLSTLIYYQNFYCKFYNFSSTRTESLIQVNEFLNQLPNGSQVLLINSGGIDHINDYTTYFNRTDRLMYVGIRALESDLLSRSSFHNPVYSFTFKNEPLDKNYPVINHIEYFIEENDLSHYLIRLDDCELITEYSNKDFSIYRNLHPDTIAHRYINSN